VLADDIGDAQARIERGHRILEDHLDGERGVPALLLVERVHRRAVEADAALARRHDAGDDTSERGLAAADSPTRPTTSPSLMARSTPSTARTAISFWCAPKTLAMRAARSSGLVKRLEMAAREMMGCSRPHLYLPGCEP